MAWLTPKTDWTGADGVRYTDLNRIEGNILDLHGKFLHNGVIASVSPSGNDTTGNGSSSAPFRTFARALSAIPKNLNGFSATIQVAAGTYSEVVDIDGFSGGEIIIAGVAGTNVTVTGLIVQGCAVLIDGINLTVGSSGIFVGAKGLLFSASSNITVSSAAEAVTLRYGGVLELTRTLTVSNATRALQVQYGSTASVATLAGSNNTIGIYAYNSAVFVSALQIVATSRIINENSIVNTRGVT